MSSPEPIGGYFELEPGPSSPCPHEGLLALSSGRACFEYVLRAAGATHVHLPSYTCDVMLEPLARLGLPHSFYAIDERLEIAALPELERGHFLVYTNYFGIKDGYCRGLADRFGGSLILDCSRPLLRTARRCPQLLQSAQIRRHPGRRVSRHRPHPRRAAGDRRLRPALFPSRRPARPGAGSRLSQFQENEADLSGQPIRLMSHSTRRLLGRSTSSGEARSP